MDESSTSNSVGATPSLTRRQALAAVALGVATALPGEAGAQTSAYAAPVLGTRGKLDIGPSSDGPISRIHPNFVKNVGRLQDLNATNQGGAYWNFDTFITPIEDFYIRNAFPTPRAELDKRVDPRFWRLKIHGDAVERELEIGYDDLLRMPSRSIISIMQCAGNGRTLFWEQQGMLEGATKVNGNSWGMGGGGVAEWQYVPMDHILGLVGLKPNAKAVLFWSGVDGKAPNTQSDTGRPTPISEVTGRSDVIGLAFKMNGQPLPADHGAPVRALVPGWCGGASTKWLTEIKIASHDFWVRLNTTDHTNIGPDYPPPKPGPNDEYPLHVARKYAWATRNLARAAILLDDPPPAREGLQFPGQLPSGGRRGTADRRRQATAAWLRLRPARGGETGRHARQWRRLAGSEDQSTRRSIPTPGFASRRQLISCRVTSWSRPARPP